MHEFQQELPLPLWGGKRKGAGRKRKAPRPQVPHRTRGKFRKGALHVTVRLRREIWNLRARRCFRAIRGAFESGCARFGFRLIHFSVQGNHVHMIVQAPDPQSLGRAMKGLEARMARGLNEVMGRRGTVFADRYHAHLLRSPREATHAVRYVLGNWGIHARREGCPMPRGVDPYCSAAPRGAGPPMVVDPLGWMLRVGITRSATFRNAA